MNQFSAKMNRNQTSVLYLSYTGLLEPLGQSQVLNYLEKLADSNSITLITFEKPEGLGDREEFERLKQQCKALNIQWQPLKYHKKPRLLATFFDLISLVLKSLKLIKQNYINVIHCRGYIPSFIGLLIKKLKGIPIIFDMRAFWPDEMVVAGRLKKNSMIFSLLKKLEDSCLQNADYVVTLTIAAADYLAEKYKDINIEQKTITIPTCVNLKMFSLNKQDEKRGCQDNFILGSVGTVTGWFKIDWLFHFYRVLHEKIPSAKLKFVSKDSPEFIQKEAAQKNINLNNLEISSCKFQEVPLKMQKMSVGSFFFEQSFAKLGSSPTRMGEFLACGIPCVANTGVGDIAHIVNKYQIGILVENHKESTMEEAVEKLQNLLKDPELTQRCRYAAEDWFSLEKGVKKYNTIYKKLST